MNKYFAGVTTIEELRRRYRELLKQFHPDNGGDEETMKTINIEYDKLFDVLNKESKSVDYAKSERQFRVNGAAVPFPTAHQRRSLFIDFITLAHAYSVHSFQDGKNAFCQ